MKYNLFLDDIRNPVEVGNYMYPVELRPMYRLEDWCIVRNYEEFVSYFEHSFPDIISFDHDLGEDVAIKRESKSGYDCAKWLVDFCIEKELPLPQYYCHSMNPIGKENILNLLNNASRILHGHGRRAR